MQADSIMDEKKRENNENDKIVSANKFSPSIDENNLSYDFYADTANKQGKEETSTASPNYQQIDNSEKKSFSSETSDILNNSERKNSNLSQKFREDNTINEENDDDGGENSSLKQFISNVKAINSNNRIPISISIENKSTSSLFKSNSKLTRKDEIINSPRNPMTPSSPAFQVVLLLEKSNSISFIVDFQDVEKCDVNQDNKGIF